MDRLNYVLDRLPSFYNKESSDSKIRAIVSAITSELDIVDSNIGSIDGLVGVDTTTSTDLDKRWGKLLSMPRRPSEDDTQYRNRMKTSVSDLSGGTQHAISYSIAVVLGINNDPIETSRRIQVIDAWLYSGTEPVNKSKGYVVCVVDLDAGTFEYKDSLDATVQKILSNTKASGVNVQLIFKNYRIMTYEQMETSTYLQLSAFRHNQMGNTN